MLRDVSHLTGPLDERPVDVRIVLGQFPWERILLDCTRLGDGSLRQMFVRVPGGRILQLSAVDDATWEGLQAYAIDAGDTVSLVDLTSASAAAEVEDEPTAPGAPRRRRPAAGGAR